MSNEWWRRSRALGRWPVFLGRSAPIAAVEDLESARPFACKYGLGMATAKARFGEPAGLPHRSSEELSSRGFSRIRGARHGHGYPHRPIWTAVGERIEVYVCSLVPQLEIVNSNNDHKLLGGQMARLV
jgi:hypothetical protein